MNTAEVIEITVRDNVRRLTAVCPHGRAVLHGGGPTSEPLENYLGARAAHAPCCRPTYVLVLAPAARDDENAAPTAVEGAA